MRHRIELMEIRLAVRPEPNVAGFVAHLIAAVGGGGERERERDGVACESVSQDMDVCRRREREREGGGDTH